MNMKTSQALKVSIDESAGQRLDNFLMSLLKGVPRSRVYQMIRRGEVRINGGRARPENRLNAGDELRVPPALTIEPTPARPNARFLEQLRASILHRDRDIICINKPFGMAVHAGSGVNCGVIEGLRLLDPKSKRVQLAHRLDRDTSGVLLVARNRRTLVALHEAFRLGRVEKTYDLLVYLRWPAEKVTVTLPLTRRDRPSRGRLVAVDREGKVAETQFTRRGASSACSWLEAVPKTGRTHQIRVHASESGHAVVGDDRYATREQLAKSASLRPRRLWLHARSLAFELGGERTRFEASAEEDFASAFAKLGAI